jgi:cytochrome c-type biogenesis protein CcmH/NrfG
VQALSAKNLIAPLVHALLARLVYQNGNRAGDTVIAMQSIQTALNLWPDEPRWHTLAAQISLGSGSLAERDDPAPAIAHLEQAIKLEPKNAGHYMTLGSIYLEEGAVHPAIQALEQASRLTPDQPDSWLMLARAFRAGGDLDQAASRAERAVTLAPNDSEALLLRGEIALKRTIPGARSAGPRRRFV